MEYDKNMEYISQTQTLVGQRKRELLDTQTGEIIWVDQITKRTYGTKNFWKCYLMDFLTVLGIIDSRQLDIFIYIVENTNPSNNIFIGTYKKNIQRYRMQFYNNRKNNEKNYRKTISSRKSKMVLGL